MCCVPCSDAPTLKGVALPMHGKEWRRRKKRGKKKKRKKEKCPGRARGVPRVHEARHLMEEHSWLQHPPNPLRSREREDAGGG